MGRYSVPKLRLPLSLGSYYSPGYCRVRLDHEMLRPAIQIISVFFHHAHFEPSQ
jgi:hypothetical protein